MDGRCLVGLYWWVSGGFLKHVWRVSEICVKRVLNLFGMSLEGVGGAQIGSVWPHLALEDIW